MRLAFLRLATPVWADHGGSLRAEGLSPLTVGLLAGGLTLVAGVLVVIIVMRLTGRSGAPRE